MRTLTAIACLTLLTACSFGTSAPEPVDPANLPPLNGREQALLLGAESAWRQGNVAAAENDYLSAIAASNGHVEAHIALAKLYAANRQPEKQRDILDRALTLQPNNPEVNYLLGKLELSSGENEAALEAFTDGLEAAPGNFDLSNGAAIANDMLGRHRTAQAMYQQIIAQHKTQNLGGVRTNLGMSYLFTNEPKKAIAILKPEATKKDSSPVTRYNLALAYSLLNKEMDAKFALRGEDDAPSRKATLERLKLYIEDSNPNKQPTNVKPALVPQKRANTDE